MGKDVIKEPFAVINADDFYGRESFAILADYLKGLEGKKNEYCMVGYRVGNTLSESGSVARGVCETNAEKHLTSVVERDIWTAIDDNAPVSMNMWGFTPDYFKYSEEYFVKFLKENADNIKAEYFIPLLVNDLIQTGKASVTVLDTPSKWFGVTYAADTQSGVDKIHALPVNTQRNCSERIDEIEIEGESLSCKNRALSFFVILSGWIDGGFRLSRRVRA